MTSARIRSSVSSSVTRRPRASRYSNPRPRRRRAMPSDSQLTCRRRPTPASSSSAPPRPNQFRANPRAGTFRGMEPLTLDHVAFWVADRRPLVERCEKHLGMHVIDEQAEFSLVGTDARYGKFTFFDADGPREPGALKHVGLRVSHLAAARAQLPPDTGDCLELGEGIRVRLVEAPTAVEYDLDHVAFATADPERTAAAFERYRL